MKKKFFKALSKITKTALPLCGIAASLCIFVANNSPNLCVFTWGYEIAPPVCLKIN